MDKNKDFEVFLIGVLPKDQGLTLTVGIFDDHDASFQISKLLISQKPISRETF